MGAPDWTAQGELLGKHLGSATTTYATDSLGRLQYVTLPSAHVVSYIYDGSSRRVGKKLDGVLQQGLLYHDGIKPVVELDGTGSVVSRFVYGSSPLVPDYVIRAGNTYRIFTDQLGSPRVVVDVSSGSVIERIDYDERGNTLNDTNPGFIPFGFAGGIVDRDTGLIRFGARDYDPSAGRWTTRDSTGLRSGTNVYEYANSNSVNFVDRTGRDGEAIAGGFWSSLYAGAAGAAARLGGAIDGLLGSGAVYGGSALAAGSGGVAIGILGGGVFLSEGKDDPIADDEGSGEGGVCGGIAYPGDDPTKAPGEGWEWRGKGPVGSSRGSWYNPGTDESLHPDLNHPDPIGPHWDVVDPDGKEFRWFPDGRIEPK